MINGYAHIIRTKPRMKNMKSKISSKFKLLWNLEAKNSTILATFTSKLNLKPISKTWNRLLMIICLNRNRELFVKITSNKNPLGIRLKWEKAI